MSALRSLGRAITRLNDRFDNVAGRCAVLLAFAGLVWLAPDWWRVWLLVAMLMIGRWTFHLFGAAIMWTLYLLLVTPVGLVVRLKDPLRLRRAGATTYWIARPEPEESLEAARGQG